MPPHLQQLREICRFRNHLVRADTRLQNHIKAILRALEEDEGHGPAAPRLARLGLDPDEFDAGDHQHLDTQELHVADLDERKPDHPACGDQQTSVVPTLVEILRQARAPLTTWRNERERFLVRLTDQLPPAVLEWQAGVKGFGRLNLGLIVGACITIHGNVLDADSVAKVWKRMGVGLWNGQAQRRCAGISQEEAEAIGYSPTRRAVMHMVGVPLLIHNDGEYRKCYDERKPYELAHVPESKTKQKHAHRRALRYMEKRVLLHLWQRWHGA